MEVILQQVGAHLVGAIAAAAVPVAQPSLAEQVGKLLVGSIPTALLFLVVVAAYEVLVQGPLTATLARRRALTEGAMEEAQQAIARAEARTAEYAEKLRQARAEAYKLREQRMKQWNTERDAALDKARHGAGHKVGEAKAVLEAEAGSARQTIQATAADLGRQAVRAVLPLAAGGTR
ncbi:MAG: ATP synthase F0 subunit B [Acidobacteriota bacterium]